MKWTTDTPTKPGWYWVEDAGRVEPWYVWEVKNGWITLGGGAMLPDTPEPERRWAGPIEEPGTEEET